MRVNEEVLEQIAAHSKVDTVIIFLSHVSRNISSRRQFDVVKVEYVIMPEKYSQKVEQSPPESSDFPEKHCWLDCSLFRIYTLRF